MKILNLPLGINFSGSLHLGTISSEGALFKVLVGRIRVLVLVGCMFPLVACSSFAQDCSRPEVSCAALVTDTGGLYDYGLTQSAWKDLQAARADGSIQYAEYIESVDTRDYGKNIDLLARQGYDIVITAGIGLYDETLLAADRYADTVFIGLDQPPDESLPNFIAVTFHEDQAGFLAGALAAQMTDTDVIGAVCETSDMATNWKACEGFRAGARHQNPEVKVLIAYREAGSRETLFRDSDWGYATGVDLIRDGADVIFGVGGGTGAAALNAAAERAVYAIGSDQDQFYVTRDAQAVLLTSLVKSVSPILFELIETLQHQLPGEREYHGKIAIAGYHDLEGRVPEQVKQDLTKLRIDLDQGAIRTEVAAESPD
jgi:basic membrane protein A